MEERDHAFVRGQDGIIYRKNRLFQAAVNRRTGARHSEILIADNRCKVAYELRPGTPVSQE